ncbi:MAG: anti-sigma factor [Chitinophagales bacterium]|nr:anti-sigma factor [Chitinophagales bacterium]
MNTTDYIESGILDLYVSGFLSTEEMRDVEAKACQYHEIKIELESLQNTLEKFVFKHSMEIRPEVKQKVIKAVKAQGTSDKMPVGRQVRAINSRNTTFSNVLAAASIVLLITIGAVAIYFSNQNKDLKKNIADLQSQFHNAQLLDQKQLNEAIAKAKESSARLKFFTDTGTTRIAMKGLLKHRNSGVIVYWNKRSHEVFLNVTSLPIPEGDQQYQLWYIDPKKGPVSAGVFSVKPGEMQKMKSASDAAAFAVTLEPKGGSDKPTLSNMYMIGTVSS